MPGRPRGSGEPLDPTRSLVAAWRTNERVNQVLLELLDPAVWREYPPCSKRRNIATTFAHIHNVRLMRLKASARGGALPERLDRGEVTPAEASRALAASSEAMAALIEAAGAEGGRVTGYMPGIVLLVVAAVSHEAHHRGQITHWARELGSPIGPEQALRLWEWDKRWREVLRT